MQTVIKAKENLFNNGQCFTKGKIYIVNNVQLTEESQLIDMRVTNDMGESHIIGNWWRKFKIV